ncbi:aminopeptidase [Clostridia bacterium]|nr:aminopeptidase [Clostridia bacterium]
MDLALLERLCSAFGPPGCEDEVRAIIIEAITPYADEIVVDHAGNLIAFKKGANRPDKRRMFAAHMDEVGFMVTADDSDEFLKADALGGIDPAVILGKRVIVGDKRIPAVFGGKPIHLIDSEDRNKTRPLDKLYLDFGALKQEKSGKDKPKKKLVDISLESKVEKLINPGDFAVFAPNFTLFGRDKSRVLSKAVDDRFGCLALIELIRSDLAYDSYFAFTTCEEIGLRGAATAVNLVKPEVAIVVETTTAGDIYNKNKQNKVCEIGRGAVISFMDNTTIYSKNLFNLAMSCSVKENIPAQTKTAVAGGNDSGIIHKSLAGVETLAVSLATRYLHSPACVADITDMESVIALLKSLENNIKE